MVTLLASIVLWKITANEYITIKHIADVMNADNVYPMLNAFRIVNEIGEIKKKTGICNR